MFGRAYALVHLAMSEALAVRAAAGALALPEDLVAAGAAWRVLERQFNRERDRLVGEVASRMRPGPEARDAVELGREVADVVLARTATEEGATPPPPTPGPGRWEGLLPHAIEAAGWQPLLGARRAGGSGQTAPPAGQRGGLARPGGGTGRRPEVDPRPAGGRPQVGPTGPAHPVGRDAEHPVAGPAGAPGGGGATACRSANATHYDAFVSCRATKFKYWTARPFQRLADLRPAIPTPHFPSYTSGHLDHSGPAAVVLAAFYPGEQAWFEEQAEEAAVSRLFGNIDFRHDNDEGLRVGRLIGQRAMELMKGRSTL